MICSVTVSWTLYRHGTYRCSSTDFADLVCTTAGLFLPCGLEATCVTRTEALSCRSLVCRLPPLRDRTSASCGLARGLLAGATTLRHPLALSRTLVRCCNFPGDSGFFSPPELLQSDLLALHLPRKQAYRGHHYKHSVTRRLKVLHAVPSLGCLGDLGFLNNVLLRSLLT